MDSANSKQPITLDDNFSTTRMVTTEKPVIENKPEDKFETVLFLPEGEGRKCEGGLRTKGYFKKSHPDKPLITVITVVFNGEKYLEETIQSVINQTYDNVEYIIIDGGSNDGTLDIIKKYQKQIDYWVSERDGGLYEAMNKGIFCSQGNLLGIINSGDVYLPETISLVVARCDSITYKRTIFTGHLKRFSRISGTEFINTRTHDDLCKAHLAMPINHPSTFVGISVYKYIGVFDLNYRIVSDNEFILRSYLSNIDFVFINAVLAKMELGGISESIVSLLSRTKEHFLIRRRYRYNVVGNLALTIKYFFLNSCRGLIKLVLGENLMSIYYKSKRQ